ncbi:MAG: alpha/beta fold hydrolase [Spirochaetes bacterium]|nr:alpha/beta fold hydrolase [Spirochaetota bacterium]
MELSRLLLKTLSIGMDALFRASEAKIRPHGLENIPSQPSLFVVNHFTRLETTFLPYLIDKYTGRYAISLAHHSFFSGRFGRFMERVGAVSTKDPDRDKIFIRALLTGQYHAIIFPEGQMVKDKKIIEKGKYWIYNMGIRRPPHRGSAIIALQSQLYREKIRRMHERGDVDGIARFSEYFGFEAGDIETIIGHDTNIVPVNITYYPVRARNNAIKRLVDRFMGPVSDRFEEEIEVEGTMVIDGVDIDINFGTPICMAEYFREHRRLRRAVESPKSYIDSDEIRHDRPFRKIDVALTFRYMDSIYRMTTVNHDHIFSYILSMIPRDRIPEIDFKNRAFLAIERIRTLGLANYHTSIDRKQYYLLTDDGHDKYNSFIETAISERLISRKNGIIVKNKEKMRMPYQFHLIRKMNIIEVLKNEIEPLTEVVRTLDRLMLPLPFTIRRRIRNHFIQLDRRLFEEDYTNNFITGETKPERIGRPEFRRRLFRRRGVLLVHGYMAAPEEMREIAESLHRSGYSVYLCRLRGHGTSPEDLAGIRWEKWYDSVSRAYIVMKNSVRRFAIIGFSTGAGLALLQASRGEKQYCGVISINAPLRLQNIASRFSSAVVFWNTLLAKMNIKKGKMEFVENNPENPHINYFRNPVSGVNELAKLMRVVEENLKHISIPTLIVQGSEDPVVNPSSAAEIFERVGTEEKELVKIFTKRHGIVRGKESHQVLRIILNFFDFIFR